MHNFAASVAAVSAQIAEQSEEPPTVYITHHELSQQIAGAFAEGCGGRTVSLPHQNDRARPDFVRSSWELVRQGLVQAGPIAVYGILRGCGEVINFAKWMRHDYFHIDNGYVRQSNHARNELNGYYRITKNGFQATEQEDRPPDRWDSLRVPIAGKWNRQGRNILVIPPSGFVAEYQGIDPGLWQTQVEAEIKKRTDRPVKVKTFKGRLEEFLPDTHCLITHESMAALHGLIEGVPSIALGNHCINELSWSWRNLEFPDYFDRSRVMKLCHWLAYSQWKLDEIRAGAAWRMLND